MENGSEDDTIRNFEEEYSKGKKKEDDEEESSSMVDKSMSRKSEESLFRQ